MITSEQHQLKINFTWNKTFNVDIDFIKWKLHLRIAYNLCSTNRVSFTKSLMLERWMGGWMDGKASLRIAFSLRIAYCNQKAKNGMIFMINSIFGITIRPFLIERDFFNLNNFIIWQMSHGILTKLFQWSWNWLFFT